MTITKKNGGLVSARKAGITVARGEYIGFVDSDDWIGPQMYEHLIEAAIKEQAVLVLGGSIEDVGGQNVYKTNRLKVGIYEKEKLQGELYPHMLCAGDFFCMGIQPYLWNKLIRRDLVYSNIMAVDDRIRVGEDVAALMPMVLQAEKIVITNDCDYHYCIRSSSMMWEYGNEEKRWEELKILHYFLQSVLTGNGNYNLIDQIKHYTVGNMLTRVYGMLVEKSGKGVLWPFGYRINSRKCILYSAGYFGRAVYGYLQRHYPDMLKLWVDQEYLMYQAMGLPVYSVDDIGLKTDADVLVAVLDMQLADLIRNNLLQLGVCREQIYCINITDGDVSQIIDQIGKAGGETGEKKHLHSRRTFQGADARSISYEDRA